MNEDEIRYFSMNEIRRLLRVSLIYEHCLCNERRLENFEDLGNSDKRFDSIALNQWWTLWHHKHFGRCRWRWNQFVSAPIKGQVEWICFLIWYTHSGKWRLKANWNHFTYFILLRTSNKILLAAQLLKLFFTRRTLTDQFSAEWTSKFLRLTIVNVSSSGTC